jgi:hypothetical protein
MLFICAPESITTYVLPNDFIKPKVTVARRLRESEVCQVALYNCLGLALLETCLACQGLSHVIIYADEAIRFKWIRD